MLPAPETVPKEMLSDRPLIQHAVDEAVEAGCDTLIFITNRDKYALADYFDKAHELEQKLTDVIAALSKTPISTPDASRVHALTACTH